MYGRKRSEKIKKAVSNANKGKIPWNKGLTKETNEIVKKYSENRKKTMIVKGYFKK